MNDWREQCLNRLNAVAEAGSDTFVRVARLVRRMGFDYCSIAMSHQIAGGRDERSWHSTYPEHWKEVYREHDFLHLDPVIDAALRSPMPVVWDENRVVDHVEFWDPARQHGIRHGWTLALRGARDETLMLSLARSHEAMSVAERAQKEALLVWLAHSTLATLVASDGANRAAPQELTPREKEILRWALAGKTADETSIILGIAPRTVNFHLHLAMERLGVVNKTQAVAKATALHLLD